MNTCETCKFFDRDSERVPLGSCSRWKTGYRWRSADIQPNEVIVEDDEGWGAMMGPKFGCVLWSSKE